VPDYKKGRIVCVLPNGKKLQDEGAIEVKNGGDFVHVCSMSGDIVSYPKTCTVIYWEGEDA